MRARARAPPVSRRRGQWPDEHAVAKSKQYSLFICGLNVFIIMVGLVTAVLTTYQVAQLPSARAACSRCGTTRLALRASQAVQGIVESFKQ